MEGIKRTFDLRSGYRKEDGLRKKSVKRSKIQNKIPTTVLYGCLIKVCLFFGRLTLHNGKVLENS